MCLGFGTYSQNLHPIPMEINDPRISPKAKKPAYSPSPEHFGLQSGPVGW